MKSTDGNSKNINTSLEFKTYHEKKGKLTRRIVLLFIVAVFAVSAVSVAVMLSEYGEHASILPVESESTELSTPDEEPLSGKVNFLLVCTDDSSSDIRYISILCADMNVPLLRLTLLSPSVECEANGFSGTLEEHFLYAGMSQLVQAAEEYTEVSIERYIKSTDSGFKKAIKLFGGIEYDVPSRAVCEMSGVSFTIEKGLQTLMPDVLMRYMVYLSDSESNDMATLAGVLSAIVDFTLTDTVLENGESLFKRLSNLFETDISVVDYSQHYTGLSAYINNESRRPVAVAADTSDF